MTTARTGKVRDDRDCLVAEAKNALIRRQWIVLCLKGRDMCNMVKEAFAGGELCRLVAPRLHDYSLQAIKRSRIVEGVPLAE
jgi:hypothetical protein